MIFELTAEEWGEIQVWRKKQDKKAGVVKGAIGKEGMGGLITYSFTPTGIGVAIVAKHNLTKEELNLTDVSKW